MKASSCVEPANTPYNHLSVACHVHRIIALHVHVHVPHLVRLKLHKSNRTSKIFLLEQYLESSVKFIIMQQVRDMFIGL